MKPICCFTGLYILISAAFLSSAGDAELPDVSASAEVLKKLDTKEKEEKEAKRIEALKKEKPASITGFVKDGKLLREKGEEVTVEFIMTPGYENEDVKIRLEQKSDDGINETKTLVPVNGKASYTTKTDKAGSIILVAKLIDKDGNPVKNPRGVKESTESRVGVLYDPLEFKRYDGMKPAGFDEFWKEQIEELKNLPMEASVQQVLHPKTRKPFEGVYAVKINCLGPRPCTGYFTCPTGASPKSLSALIRLPGWNPGAHAACPGKAPVDRIEFNISIHGMELGESKEYYDKETKSRAGYVFNDPNPTPKETHLYGMLMRTLRAIQFLKSRPEWNGQLTVTGYSQGGFLTLASAALDPDVTTAIAYAPWLCDIGAKQVGRLSGWTPAWTPGTSFFDVNFFTPMIRCNTTINAGLTDDVCPPSGVMTAYGAMTCPKRLTFYQGHGHGAPDKVKSKKDILTWNSPDWKGILPFEEE